MSASTAVATRIPWRPAPGTRELTIAIAAADETRQAHLRRVFGAGRLPTDSRATSRLDRGDRLAADVYVIDELSLISAEAPPAWMPVWPCGIPVVILVDSDENVDVAIAALKEGASAVLARHVPSAQLREAVLSVLRGEAVVPPAVAAEVARQVRLADRPS